MYSGNDIILYIWILFLNLNDMSNKPKTVKLRAFSIANYEMGKKDSGLMEMLSDALSGSVANNRRMRLNEDDPQKEEDLISDFTVKGKIHLCGAILRIASSGDIPNIPDNYLEKEKITITDLDTLEIGASTIYKTHYYFLLNNNYMITTLQGNISIKRFQTYINWLLEDVRGDQMFEFTPCVTNTPKAKLSELKNIIFKNNNIQTDFKPINQEGVIKSNISKAGEAVIKLFINDTAKLEELKEAQIISAELLIKFSRPAKMSKEDYEKKMGAYLKPFADTEDVVFTTKRGDKVTGAEILRTKSVEIELTDSLKISEPQLYQEMEKFLKEVCNEKSN